MKNEVTTRDNQARILGPHQLSDTEGSATCLKIQRVQIADTPVLDRRSLRLRVLYAYEQTSEDEMEEAECEVDAVDSEDAVAGIAVSARNLDVVVGPAFEALDGPVGQHDPGEHAIEQEDDGVAYAGAVGDSMFRIVYF